MKTIRFTAFLISFGLLVLVFACKKETTPVALTQSGSKILVTGQDGGTGLKSTLSGQTTVWKTIDQVGIYSTEARTASGGGTAIINVPFTAATAAATSAFNGTMYWGAATTSHTFYAYYPYSAGSAASSVVPVTLPATQTQSEANNSDHIGAFDFLVATPKTVISPANTNQVANEVNLSYNHLFTILEFQIKGSGTLKAVKLLGTSNPLAFSGGTINIGQSPPATDVAYTLAIQTGATTQATVTLTSTATLDATTATTVYMVIKPGTQTGNCLIGLSSDGTTWNYISQAAPTGGFLRGKKYVVNINKELAASLVDQDGNNFGIVTIGTQTWMAENLKTTKYNDGNGIPLVTDGTAWKNLGTPGYCWNNNDATTYKNAYGAFYNWFTVETGKLCPTGWHVPTHAEWTTFTTYLTDNGYGYGGSGVDIAKSMASQSGWTSDIHPGYVGNDQTSNNASGFTAVAAGMRYSSDGIFEAVGYGGYWWSSTGGTGTNGAATTSAFYRPLYSDWDQVAPNYNFLKQAGVSVRCLMD